MSAASARIYGRITAVLVLVSFVAGAFGELIVPSRLLVTGDAAATARAILASETLFRLGFGAYVLEAICDATLTMLFYVLLAPVSRPLALLAVLFRIISTAVFAMGEIFYFAALPILHATKNLEAFSPEQVQALAFMSLKVYAPATALPSLFYGLASCVLGYLMIRSGYIPRVVGALFVLAGTGFVLRNAAYFLAPRYASSLLYAPMSVAAVALAGWLLLKGVDPERWEARRRAIAPVA